MTKEEMNSKIKELTEENQRLRIAFEKEKKNIPVPIYSPYPMPCVSDHLQLLANFNID